MARLTDTGDTRAAVHPRTGALAGNLDRILMGVCVAAWLAALGTGVAATVALADLGRRQPDTPGGSDTPWLLYTVIGVSAVVIVAAVPLLLRARRAAQAEPAPAPLTRDRPAPVVPEPATERMRAVRPATVPASLPQTYPTGAVDQLWLRSVLSVTTAMGVALIAIGAATYLMAVENDTVAWVLYGLAAVVTLAMPIAPWWYLRRLRELVEPAV
ncbi:DUF2561 family protein [Mycolicibacterium sp. S2-37]|uniref:DUF2561 family protein n=1 Tax=Mycolicibacterium sp. S2-37 TaxID=2810297 RepID=UPI001A940D0C|nr:DUF2561 family protein [Mycolicibacterium sp. S2-37]MBO0680519.1 DUF2561 family protein [Mycolicibacterium sp. S2-37]